MIPLFYLFFRMYKGWAFFMPSLRKNCQKIPKQGGHLNNGTIMHITVIFLDSFLSVHSTGHSKNDVMKTRKDKFAKTLLNVYWPFYFTYG